MFDTGPTATFRHRSDWTVTDHLGTANRTLTSPTVNTTLAGDSFANNKYIPQLHNFEFAALSGLRTRYSMKS